MFRLRESKKKLFLLLIILIVSLLKYFGLIFPNFNLYNSQLWPDEKEYKNVS
jgi:hypothetical protein